MNSTGESGKSTTYRVVAAPRAQTDLDEVVGYIARDSVDAALGVHESLVEAIWSLARMPRRCPAAPEDEELRCGLRQHLSGKYRILFTVDEVKRVVSVLRIIHGARRYVEADDLEP